MLALTEITGKSICGSDATGSAKNPAMPASATPAVSSTVPIGRTTKGRDRFIGNVRAQDFGVRPWRALASSCRAPRLVGGRRIGVVGKCQARGATTEAIEREV